MPIWRGIPKSSNNRCTSFSLANLPGAPLEKERERERIEWGVQWLCTSVYLIDMIPAALSRFVCWLVGISVSISSFFKTVDKWLRFTSGKYRLHTSIKQRSWSPFQALSMDKNRLSLHCISCRVDSNPRRGEERVSYVEDVRTSAIPCFLSSPMSWQPEGRPGVVVELKFGDTCGDWRKQAMEPQSMKGGSSY